MNTTGEDRERRLATIVAADIFGFSRLMDADEEGTYTALRAARSDVIDPRIEEHKGRIVKHTGDGFLAEFPTVLAAVQFAMAMQEEMGPLVKDTPKDKRVRFRIGINLGDIIVDDDGDIFGDGVNVAARLENLGIPGGICISESVYESVRKKLDVIFDDLGDQSVKNIPTPVHAYDVRWEGEAGTPHDRAVKPTSKRRRVAVTIGAVALVLTAGLVAVNTLDFGPDPAAEDEFDHIAVLPFKIQGDESLAYLRDGMVTILSGMLDGAGPIRSIDANRVNGYVERHPDFIIDPEGGQTIAAALGADRYVIGTLIQAGSEKQLEATLYDANGASLSIAQSSFTGDDTFMPSIDALARQLIGGQLENPDTELPTLASESTNSVLALKSYLLAEQALRDGDWDLAVDLALAATEEDSTFALAWYALSEAYGWVAKFGAGREAAFEAYKYVDRLAGSLRLLIEGSYAFDAGKPRDGERIFRQMVREYPNDVRAIGELAETLFHYNSWFVSEGDPLLESWDLFNRIIELDPTNNEGNVHLAELALKYGGATQLDSLIARVQGDNSLYTNIQKFLTENRHDANALLANRPDLDSVFYYARFAYYDNNYAVAAELNDYLHENRYDFSTRGVTSATAIPTNRASAGRLKARNRYFEEFRSPELQAHELANRVFDAILPGFECCADELAVLENDVKRFDPAELDKASTQFFAWHEAASDYLLGLISWNKGDDAALQTYADRFDSEWSGEGAIVASFGRELRGLVAWRKGDLKGALEHFESVLGDFDWIQMIATLPGRATHFWFTAEIMIELGRYEDAIRYLDYTYRDRSYGQWRGPSVIRQGEVYELMGDFEAAIECYERVQKIWSQADEELQPQLDQAMARRDELLRQLGREPADLPSPAANR